MKVLQRDLQYCLKQLHARLWQLTFYFPAPVNCWLWKESDGLTLIDAAQPWNTSQILSAIEVIGVPLRRIIITHAHPDHCGAASELAEKTGAEVYAHQLDIAYLQHRACMADTKGSLPSRLVLNVGRIAGLLNVPAVKNVISVSDGTTVGSLSILFTPGHTPGAISIYSHDQSALFCGDNMSTTANKLSINFTWFTLDTKTLCKSIGVYKTIDVNMVLPGHGPAMTGELCKSELRRALLQAP